MSLANSVPERLMEPTVCTSSVQYLCGIASLEWDPGDYLDLGLELAESLLMGWHSRNDVI